MLKLGTLKIVGFEFGHHATAPGFDVTLHLVTKEGTYVDVSIDDDRRVLAGLVGTPKWPS